MNHELLDDAVEGGSLVAKTFLTRGQSPKILSRPRDRLSVETNDDPAEMLITMRDVKIDLEERSARALTFGYGRSRRTFEVIVGPFAASTEWAKNRNPAVSMSSKEMTIFCKEAMMKDVNEVGIQLTSGCKKGLR